MKLSKVLITLGVLAGMLLAAGYRHWRQPTHAPVPRSKVTLPPLTSEEKVTVQKQTVRLTQNALDQADQSERAELNARIEKHLTVIDGFFAERKQGVPAFTDALLSMSGSWKLIKAQASSEARSEHLQFMQKEFEKNLFSAEELRDLVTRSIQAFLAEQEAQDNAFLVKLRADITDYDPRAVDLFTALQAQNQFQQEYTRMVQQVLPDLVRDLQVTMGREAATFVAGEVASQMAVRVLSALGVRLGILSTGTVSGTVSFGVGLIIAFILDYVVDQVMKLGGYDATTKVRSKVDSTLETIREALTRGHPEAKSAYAKLRELEKAESDYEVRKEYTQAAETIARGGMLEGLRGELQQLYNARVTARRHAITQLISAGQGSGSNSLKTSLNILTHP